MATVQTLKDKNDNTFYPVTKTEAVYNADGSETLDNTLNTKATISTSAGDANKVMMADGTKALVTSDNIDFTTPGFVYQPGDSITIGNQDSGIYWAGRQRAQGTSKYIYTQIILDKPISSSVSSLSFTPSNYNECFGDQGLIYSINNPTSSQLTYTMNKTGMKNIIRVVIAIVDGGISVSANHPCSVNIQGTLTFS